MNVLTEFNKQINQLSQYWMQLSNKEKIVQLIGIFSLLNALAFNAGGFRLLFLT
jgi:hypothetical protein